MVTDRGYAGSQPRDVIVRTGWNTLRLEKLDGKPFNLTGVPRQMGHEPGADPLNAPWEWTVQTLYGRGKTLKRLSIRGGDPAVAVGQGRNRT
jgi:hypothetical protein